MATGKQQTIPLDLQPRFINLMRRLQSQVCGNEKRGFPNRTIVITLIPNESGGFDYCVGNLEPKKAN